MAEIQLYTPMAGTQISSSIVQPQNPNCLIGLQLLNNIVGTQLLTIMVGPQLKLSAIKADHPVCLCGPKSTPNWLFFKIFKFSGPSLPGITSFTPQAISYLGFIMTIVIVISFARKRKLYPMSVHLN